MQESQLPMRERSFLGQMLPDGLLFILSKYGADRFAEVFVGGADTPEVIWSPAMRQRLIELVRQHLGDFPLRLFQNTTTEYEYCPIPGVSYQRLDGELFCHHYYLRNLCDEVRFPDWPISEPSRCFVLALKSLRSSHRMLLHLKVRHGKWRDKYYFSKKATAAKSCGGPTGVWHGSFIPTR